MDRSNPWVGSLKVAAFLIWLLSMATQAGAGPISYQTQGDIFPWKYGDGGSSGITGTNVINFQNLSAGTLSAPGALPLGQFVVNPLPDGQSTTYNNAAFLITLNTNLGGQPVPAGSNDAPFSSVQLYGVLNGTVTGSGQSSVVAHVMSITPNSPISDPENPKTPILDLPFPLSALTADQSVTLGPSSVAGGVTPFSASLSVVPEPSSLLVFLLGAGTIGVFARRGRGR
jgi:PEP-CTERM motif